MAKIIHPELLKYGAETSDLAVDSESTGYVRPKTRGELRDKLKQGIECEVVTSNVETTRMLIDGWLCMGGKYDVRPSENAGWSVFFPHTWRVLTPSRQPKDKI